MATKQKKKIFIVEGDDFLLDMYTMKFSSSPELEVEIAKSGEEALEKLRSGYRPDAVMFDIVMPGLDGLGMFKIIKEERIAPEAVFIIISNLGQKEDIEKGLRMGADDYIVKAHFTPTEILNKVNDLLSRKKTLIKAQ